MGIELDATTRAQEFRKNNGIVMRRVNILRTDYAPVHDVILSIQEKSPTITEGQLRDSFNFLLRAEYLEMQYIRTKEPIARIAGVNLHELEATLTLKGIRLMSGSITDADVTV
ncbi:hypothetical protein LJC60_09890 [Ruminococcaceae bacterium OttesenSCG-928-D13]|nr:hypothetical protein [Ruminococcaceae bacterium OttesenSCG-928-D13]